MKMASCMFSTLENRHLAVNKSKSGYSVGQKLAL